MFIELQSVFPQFFELHPVQLSAYLDAVWETWRQTPGALPGAPFSATSPRAVLPGVGKVNITAPTSTAPLAITFAPPLQLALQTAQTTAPTLENAVQQVLVGGLGTASKPKFVPPFWRHLVYAYLIENTRAFEIFQKVLSEGLQDESFGTLSDDTLRWLRTTEELFFSTSGGGFLSPIVSAIRPDPRAMRRNAYYRMFGMDLNHGAADGGAYPYFKAQAANVEFVKVFQDLLRELWRGYINAGNIQGPNTTDESNIVELINRLKVLLNARRQSAVGHANLLREEFEAVATLSWFELALSPASPLVNDLKANGAAPEEILRRLGERVKLPPHAKARSFFFLAKDLPGILRSIELGVFDNLSDAQNLYKNAGTPRDAILSIINHWSIATGVELKSVPVASGQR